MTRELGAPLSQRSTTYYEQAVSESLVAALSKINGKECLKRQQARYRYTGRPQKFGKAGGNHKIVLQWSIFYGQRWILGFVVSEGFCQI